MSKLDFDSTPPVASTRPSGLKAIDVTVFPIVPAVMVPNTFVISAFMSAMFGIVGMVGIEPRFPGFGNDPRFGIDGMLARGFGAAGGAKLRTRLPDATFHITTSPWPATVIKDLPSAEKPTLLGDEPGLMVCNSRPETTSQILTWLDGTPPFACDRCDACASIYLAASRRPSGLKFTSSTPHPAADRVSVCTSRPVVVSRIVIALLLGVNIAIRFPSGLGMENNLSEGDLISRNPRPVRRSQRVRPPAANWFPSALNATA